MEAAWPLTRADLHLSYAQIGVLFAAPHLFASVVEPVLALLGDAWDRRALLRAGGVAFVLSLALMAASHGFVVLLAALMLLDPASGVLVGLGQATLMDADPAAHERDMARWTLAGSVGALAGPLLLALGTRVGLGWRGVLAACAVPTALVVALLWPALRSAPDAMPEGPAEPLGASLVAGAREALRALRRGEVVRWLVLLELADLMLDVLHGYLALYIVDVARLGVGGASAAMVVWTGVGLVGDALLLPLLDRVRGTTYLRWSALATLALYPAFLLASGAVPKLALLGAVGLLRAGWYAILKARLYAALPGQSAAVMALGNVAGLAGGLLPLALGMVAERYGLGAAMWVIVAAPVALLVGVGNRSA